MSTLVQFMCVCFFVVHMLHAVVCTYGNVFNALRILRYWRAHSYYEYERCLEKRNVEKYNFENIMSTSALFMCVFCFFL